jgi:nucleoside-diphosphate-sugar epimerase
MEIAKKSTVIERDLALILSETSSLWPSLKNQKVFLTGGTGFFGSWFLETLACANRELQLGAEALVLSRNQEAFAKRRPHLAKDNAIHFHHGDVRMFEFPNEPADFIVHAATPASAALNQANAAEMFDTIVAGTKRVLEYANFCQEAGTNPRILLISSGAVYGDQPAEVRYVSESFIPGTQQPSAYVEGKRESERLCNLAHQQSGLDVHIARCFSFVGPYLALNEGFAIGNFIRDGLSGEPICVQGDGSPERSYLYTADLMIQLWTLLISGPSGQTFNVGSEESITVKLLAEKIGAIFNVPVNIAGGETRALSGARYVPSTEKLRTVLNLEPRIDLTEAIARTIHFYEKN